MNAGRRQTTEERPALDVRQELHRRLSGAVVEWVPWRFGGKRPLFLCPRCARRAVFLYQESGAFTFACRRCCGLGYESEREPERYRVLRQVNKLRARLGWPPGNVYETGPKPPKMYGRTFWRLRERYYRLLERLAVAEMRWLKVGRYG